MIYYTTESPFDLDNHPYQNRWIYGACDLLDIDARGILINRNIPNVDYPKILAELDSSIQIQELDRATFEDMVENSQQNKSWTEKNYSNTLPSILIHLIQKHLLLQQHKFSVKS